MPFVNDQNGSGAHHPIPSVSVRYRTLIWNDRRQAKDNRCIGAFVIIITLYEKPRGRTRQVASTTSQSDIRRLPPFPKVELHDRASSGGSAVLHRESGD